LGDIEIFGENLYAIHSIEYKKLEHHFYVFAIRYHNTWLSWEEVKFYAAMFDFPTVPVLQELVLPVEKKNYEQEVLDLISQPGRLHSVDIITGLDCSMEGLVTRNAAAFAVDDFEHHVFKYVRKGHVKTDAHWTRNWKRARLRGE
jgi:hypothetical protein